MVLRLHSLGREFNTMLSHLRFQPIKEGKGFLIWSYYLLKIVSIIASFQRTKVELLSPMLLSNNGIFISFDTFTVLPTSLNICLYHVVLL